MGGWRGGCDGPRVHDCVGELTFDRVEVEWHGLSAWGRSDSQHPHDLWDPHRSLEREGRATLLLGASHGSRSGLVCSASSLGIK